MASLDAAALTTDTAGLEFLADVLGTTGLSKQGSFPPQPKVEELGRAALGQAEVEDLGRDLSPAFC